MGFLSNYFIKVIDRLNKSIPPTPLDEVSSIKKSGRDTYKYMEGNHVMEVYAEQQIGDPLVIIDSRSFDKWLPPYDHESIPNEHKQQIIHKVLAYLKRINVSFKIN